MDDFDEWKDDGKRFTLSVDAVNPATRLIYTRGDKPSTIEIGNIIKSKQLEKSFVELATFLGIDRALDLINQRHTYFE